MFLLDGNPNTPDDNRETLIYQAARKGYILQKSWFHDRKKITIYFKNWRKSMQKYCKYSWIELSGTELSWVMLNWPESSRVKLCQAERKKSFFKQVFNFLLNKLLFFTYKAYILRRIKRAILFDKSKIALKSKQIQIHSPHSFLKPANEKN